MIISPEMIESKEIVGKNREGTPVLMIVTKGGLYAFFTKTEKGVKTIGTAPHKAIGAWICEQQEDGITWNEGFLKSEQFIGEDLKKSVNAQEDMFLYLRDIFFSKSAKSRENISGDYYLFYDPYLFNIGIMHKSEIIKDYRDGKLSKSCMVRPATLSKSAEIITKRFIDDN